MSYNRQTKTYWETVQRFSKEIYYSSSRIETPEDIEASFKNKFPDAPRYMLEDVMKLSIDELKSSIYYDEQRTLEAKLRLEIIIEAEDKLRRPRLRLVKGAA